MPDSNPMLNPLYQDEPGDRPVVQRLPAVRAAAGWLKKGRPSGEQPSELAQQAVSTAVKNQRTIDKVTRDKINSILSSAGVDVNNPAVMKWLSAYSDLSQALKELQDPSTGPLVVQGLASVAPIATTPYQQAASQAGFTSSTVPASVGRSAWSRGT